MDGESPRASLPSPAQLLDLRAVAGLSQRELAERAGVSVRALRDIEHGRVRRPHLESIRRLTDALAAVTAGDPSAGPPPSAAPSAERVEVSILGPIELRHGTRVTSIASRMQRTLLALLALHPGRPVPRHEIVDVLWDDQPPRTAVNLVHIYIGQVRRLLAAERGSDSGTATRIAWSGNGYQLVNARTDAGRFEDRVSLARADRSDAAAARAMIVYRDALARWRGPVAADAHARLRQHPAAVALEHLRLTATVEWADLAIDAGEPEQAVASLRDLAHAEPLHEAVHARLMLVLAALGDKTGALQIFAEVRGRLAEELGVVPGDELREAHRRVLRGDTRARPAVATVTAPAQVPAGVQTFTGRAGLLAQLDALLESRDRPDTSAGPTVCLVTGPAGVGKSTLAAVWAHRVRAYFPAGQLYVDLRGHAPTSALRPVEALVQLLLGLGTRPEQIPTEAEPAAALLRSRLAGQRALLLLDDAYSVEQVRPLLPADPRCVVLVTSRHRLDGLVVRHDARRVSVPLLTPAEGRDLLGRLLGRERVANQRSAVAQLAALCEGLPLALRVAAANLRSEPDRDLAGFVAELEAGDRLGRLEVAGDEWGGVRRAFDYSYRLLPRDAARVFRLLGLAPGATISVPAAGALAGLDEPATGRAVAALAAASLVEAVRPGRYAMHDLLRLYAAERAAIEEGEPERMLAPLRLSRHYLTRADEAAELLYPGSARLLVASDRDRQASPGFADRAAALSWLDEERSNLVAVVRYATEHGHHAVAVLLADALRGYFHLRMYLADWSDVASTALDAARAAADPAGEAAATLSLALLRLRTGDRRRAVAGFAEVLRLSRQARWLSGATAALSYVGALAHVAGRPEAAAAHYRRAYALNRRAGRRAQQATNLLNLGLVRFEQGLLTRAARHYEHAHRLYGEVGALGGEAVSLGNLGEIDSLRGRLDRAEQRLTASLTALREAGHRGGQAEVLRCLAEVRRDEGDRAAALGLAQAALDLASETRIRRAEIACRRTLGTILRCLGDGAAVEEYERALVMARADGDGYHLSSCLTGLADAYRASGEADRALRPATEAVSVARRGAYRLREADALGVLAATLAERGRRGQAARAATLATALYRACGVRHAAATSLALRRACS